MNLVLWW